ncbi:hypothetical protein [Limnohabitans sp. MMS-10A-160]|jgi:hypothetical protein|nr:hypothetical protein [Limnohabitans sp. MMS-10A-160]
MNESSVIVSKEIDANRSECVEPWFTFVISGLLIAIFLALFIATF